jgi:hypothetical protein
LRHRGATQLISLADLPFVGKVVVSIPLAMLRPGVNTIGLASGQLGPNPGDNAHDDFVFGEVVLILSS